MNGQRIATDLPGARQSMNCLATRIILDVIRVIKGRDPDRRFSFGGVEQDGGQAGGSRQVAASEQVNHDRVVRLRGRGQQPEG